MNASDLIFAFTNAFVARASLAGLQGQVIRAAINHLNALKEKNKFRPEPAYQAQGLQVLEMMHPECVLEWVKGLDLQISEEQFKRYASQMI